MAAPPTLEAEIARPFGVGLGIDGVLLCPQGVGRIEPLHVHDQPGTVEQSGAGISGQGGQPAAAQHTAGISHGVLAVHPGPV